MNFEQALIAAVISVVGALCFVCRVLWTEALDCKRDRKWLRERVEKLEGDHGIARGKVQIYENCHSRSCPFRGPDSPHIPHLPA